jgi:hypothetical protein
MCDDLCVQGVESKQVSVVGYSRQYKSIAFVVIVSDFGFHLYMGQWWCYGYVVLGADEAASPPGDVPLSKSHYV